MNANLRYRSPATCALSFVAFVLLSTSASAQIGGRAIKNGAGGVNSNSAVAGAVSTTPTTEPTPPAGSPVLYLEGGDWLAGAPAASSQPNRFGWQSPAFTQPFEFDLPALTRVRFPARAAPAWRDHDYRLELAGGDVLYGELLSVTDDHLVLETSLAGKLLIKRSAVRCLERCRANALVYLGPNGLAEWENRPADGAWREDEGQLVTDKDGALLYNKIDLPARALVEFDVSSLFPPAFRLSLGVGDGAAIRRDGFRLEVVDHDVIAVYETSNDIDVARVMTLTPGPDRDRVHLRVLLDQEQQRADVFSPEGLSLATVHAGADSPRVLPGICLEHKRGGLRLERLRVWRWTGALPQPVAVGRPQLHRIDGSIVYGRLSGYDAERRQFVVSAEKGDETCIDEQVARICFGEPPAPQQRPMRVACADGTQLSGWFASVDGERLSLECLAIDTPKLDTTSLPLAAVAGIAFSYEPDEKRKAADRASLMQLDSGRTRGRLAPSKVRPGQGGLAWQPLHSSVASPLRENTAAHVDGWRGTHLPAKSEATGLDTIYLDTGDTFRCFVTQIDEVSVHCRTASATKQIAHKHVKAIELHSNPPRRQRTVVEPQGRTTVTGLAADKLERLLTLPRLQRDDPPAHILVAGNGDYLRGWLVSLSESSLRYKAGPHEREYPRDRIAGLIWLHPENLEANDAGGNKAAPSGGVYAVCVDGTRIAFTAEEIGFEDLIGASEVLGECRLPLDKLGELFIGDRARQATTQVAYYAWTLTPAPDPKAFQSGGDVGSPADSGKDSSLVGQPAPDFQLDLVDGLKFHLAEQKGHKVVLDFWASWCAPCVQSLPKLARTVADMEGADVKLVAVNLQQSSDEVKRALERMDLKVPAALDRDGAVARQYGATAIPYTVVIAPDGKVARVFIGAGAETEKQMRAALDELRVSEPLAKPGE